MVSHEDTVFPENVASVEQEQHTRLSEQNELLDAQVRQTVAEKVERLGNVELLRTSDYTVNSFERRVGDRLFAEVGLEDGLAIARPSIKGKKVALDADLAINAIPLVESLGRTVPLPEVSKRVVEALTADDLVGSVEAAGPFINVKVDIPKFAEGVFGQVATEADHYGWSRDGAPEVVVIDYSSPNVAKNLTVAHLRSTIIGQSIMHLQEATGNIPVGINHIGDWGTHFGNIIYQYQQEIAERGDEFLEELNQDPAQTLMTIYRKFNGNLEHMSDDEKRAALDAGRAIFLDLEQGDPEYTDLWFKFRDWSLDNFFPIYKRLNNVEFDAIQGESFYEGRMKPAVDEALEAGVLVRKEDGSVVFPSQPLVDPATMKENPHIMLSQDGTPRDEMIIKPSGGTVYLTRDIAAIMYRTRELGASKLLYVIGKEQGEHCIELFNMAHQLGVIALGDAQHVSFGHLNVGGRKMSSRTGRIMLLEQLLDEACEAAGQVIETRDRPRDGVDKAALAETVGIGATIFNDLRQDRIKDIEFDPEQDVAKMVEGGAVYIQYTHARLQSILEKATATTEYTADNEYAPVAHKSERDVLVMMSLFPRVVKDAAEHHAPHKVANFLAEFCQAVNTFRADKSLHVIDADTADAGAFRVELVRSSAQVIKNAASLLHLEVPDRM